MIYTDDNIHIGIEKLSGVLPEFLAKARRDGYIDPRSDDFSKNQAFGRAVGTGYAGSALGALAGYLARSKRSPAAVLAGAGLGAIGSGALQYRHSLKKFREAQKKGLNPVTLKKHDPEKIERTRRWAKARMKKRKKS